MATVSILTAGYGNRGYEKFLELLRQHGVTHLVDVRAVPQSGYWEDFRKERISMLMRSTEIKYIWMGDTLGGVKDSPVLCKDGESIDWTPFFKEEKLEVGLRKLIEAASVPGRKICLMCGCLRPHKCHRSRLLGTSLVERGVEVLHLDDEGRPVPQEIVDEQSRPVQATLF